MKTELDQWFVAEVLVHEAALTRYLRRVCPRGADVADLRQDVYVRIYESAGRCRPTLPKSFLFATARNLIADRIRRDRVVSIDYTQDLESLTVLVDEISPERRWSAGEELRCLSDALDALSDRCRDVIWLRRIEGLSQREAAQRLGMQEGTLESHMCRGVRALAAALFANGSSREVHVTQGGSPSEAEHG